MLLVHLLFLRDTWRTATNLASNHQDEHDAVSVDDQHRTACDDGRAYITYA